MIVKPEGMFGTTVIQIIRVKGRKKPEPYDGDSVSFIGPALVLGHKRICALTMEFIFSVVLVI